ncbi:LLM class F420-dependent oxidoreductase [Rhodococcus rhodnii]|uniref:Luciferase-like domain-containing protein n=2 Tax=Rhodococcus rhodnii TaxID=38312 RepID=R7WQB2_9NOCA|nr:LLM class F420-dependent oxidoreductase [Rhodococcus rhodnii]EOM77493.1 hypothetical protein Rrhod_1170 [Rhodococcus rhodnii LMG 5362]TXG90362.1 LLM class F420-dependent oxidoreductase [Rhodococcus rhodnii]
MRLSVVVPVETGETADPDWIVPFARAAESLGFDEISAVEHAVVVGSTESRYPYASSGRSHLPDDCDIPDPLELLSFVAGATERLGLATGVLVLPDHHPVVLAKRLATLDRLSRGRVRICVGMGWMREEIEACGGDFASRGRRADEAITLMRALWSGEGGVDVDGEYYSVHRAYSYPKPARTEGVPIHIGGHSAAAARRAGRLGDGFQPLGLSGEALDGALDTVRTTARESGRDPADVEIVLGGLVTRLDERSLDRARARGASRMVLSLPPDIGSVQEAADHLTACVDRIAVTR